MTCPKFIQSRETTAQGALKDSCLKCGKTEKAHAPPGISIVFGGKLWKFRDWKEAQSFGFYLY